MEGESPYIFPYVFLHSSIGELNDLLTTLYLDRDLQIRSVEVIRVENSDIFSKDLTRKISEKLMDMITELEKENLELRNLLNEIDIPELHGKIIEGENKVKIYLLSIIDFGEKRADLLINKDEKISVIKEKASKLFDLKLNEFHLSFEGIMLNEDYTITDYEITNGDEIVIIPARNH